MTDPYGWLPRLANYTFETGFPESLFVAADGRLVGTWIMGNDYRVKSGFYGGYPATYLKRIKALFPEKNDVLHLFSGRVDLDTFPGDTVDINPDLNPTFVDDAQTLSNVPLDFYDLVMCDAPYSVEDAEHYGTSMVSRVKVMRALQRTAPGTHIVILDQVLWMWTKEHFDLIGVVGVVKSYNHRFRVIAVFRRK
jgi:hypothetical protein